MSNPLSALESLTGGGGLSAGGGGPSTAGGYSTSGFWSDNSGWNVNFSGGTIDSTAGASGAFDQYLPLVIVGAGLLIAWRLTSKR